MATVSPRSFSQYSGIDRFKQMQRPPDAPPDANQTGETQKWIPSAWERLQDPGRYAPGTAVGDGLRKNFSWAMPLSERPATPVGRSWYDPSRQAERLVRGTGRPGQLQGAMIRQNLQPEPDQFEQILQQQAQNFGDTTNYGNPQQRGPLRSGYLGGSISKMGRSAVGNAFSGNHNPFGFNY